MFNKEKVQISFDAIRFPNTVKLSEFYAFTESLGLKKNEKYDSLNKTSILIGGLDGCMTMNQAADVATEIEEKFNATIRYLFIHRKGK